MALYRQYNIVLKHFRGVDACTAACSGVGHLFRDPSHRPYDVDVNTVVYNYKRLAELWAQDHLDYFYKMKPEAVSMKLTDMEPVKANYNKLKEELGCKDLKWYLENVDHEMDWERDVLCHPHAPAGHEMKCKGRLIPGRWTVTQTIPKDEYLQRKQAADERNGLIPRHSGEL
ncbi:gly-5 [Symbiodinium sp. KB8]|nr:gly-5 [Symbiodinium sp. KB8]